MYKIIQKIWLWWITSSKELSKRKIASLVNTHSEYPIIFEIGSYDGKDAQEIYHSLIFPTIFCFEADKRIYNTFNKNVGTLRAIHLEKYAIANYDGEVEFNLSDSDTRRHQNNFWSASSSLKEPNMHLELFQDVKFENKVKVDCKKLDTWYKQKFIHVDLKYQKIAFIWCDINGAEEDFILGAYSVLNNHTRYLYIEFSDKELYKGQITKDRILELLPNFELIGIYNYKGNFGNLLLKNKIL